ncbi:hypothetical protein BO71DRAFT_396777 [Aspergillus ellipticus CBS 707.79]|uniref:LSM domain-containing protein n=1 Tax=Aspergillus ellipticus CBS 707.79 TaxID=1448320 RepID=A0A319DH96_9EURO|nr:hypothetical protein BO71DRAFT_396777 [Aspergillus ellipticus CBS 707.79]
MGETTDGEESESESESEARRAWLPVRRAAKLSAGGIRRARRANVQTLPPSSPSHPLSLSFLVSHSSIREESVFASLPFFSDIFFLSPAFRYRPTDAMGKLTSTIGIPIKLLNEAQGHVVTLEITSGVVYRGKLLEGASPASWLHIIVMMQQNKLTDSI